MQLCIPNPSPTYPYTKVQEYLDATGQDEILRKVYTYLMDMPLDNYQPQTDNQYPRVRLMKYLYNDTVLPLNDPVPTVQQKWGLVFDPLHPTEPPDREKGYRIFPQSYVAQAQTIGTTAIRCYMGPGMAKSVFREELSVVFEITTNVAYECLSGTVTSRTYAMECEIKKALIGVNLGGVGTFYYDRTQHTSCGSTPIDDRGTNVGRRLILGLTWQQ